MVGQEWVWVQVHHGDYAHLDAVEAWVVRALGQDSYLVVHQRPADEDLEEESGEDSPWQVYSVMTEDIEGHSGLEHLDSYDSMDAARVAVDRSREETLRVVQAELELAEEDDRDGDEVDG